MSSSRLELLRGAFELIENLEKALSQAYEYKERYVRLYFKEVIFNIAKRECGM
jgi:hypothetical protein